MAERRPLRPRRIKISKLTRTKAEYVDYKDADLLRQFIDTRGKIMPRRNTGNSAKHQRMIAEAIKRARYMALVPYVDTGSARPPRPGSGPRDRGPRDGGSRDRD